MTVLKRWSLTRLQSGVILALGLCAVPSALPQTCIPTPLGMAAWWPADGNANDIIASHRGTLQGGVTFVPGVVDEAFNFDGTSGYVEIPSSAALQPPSAISITAWVNPKSFSIVGGNTIAAKYSGEGQSWFLGAYTPTGQIEWEVFDGSSDSPYVTEAALEIGSWQFVAATFDGTTQTWAVYINGVSQPLSCRSGYVCTPVGPISQTSTPVQIGAAESGATPNGFWSGSIDEVQVLQVVLTPAQVLAIYNAGSSGVCTPPWTGSHRYFRGDKIHDPAKHVQVVVNAGTSGATEPLWNNASATTVDATVLWYDLGVEP